MQQNNKESGQGAGAGRHPLDNYTVQPQQSDGGDKSPYYHSAAPSIALPKGGGALKGIDEKFSVNAVNGTAGLSVPLPLTQGRNGFTPSLALSYSSGAGNSEFGLGWGLGLPAIQRRTDKQLPQYDDANESDVFLLAGAEDLVPMLKENGDEDEFITGSGLLVKRYRPRIEGLFARIEFIRNNTGASWWRVTTKDDCTTWYGYSAEARISRPDHPADTFKWLPELVIDNKGNVQHYTYKAENLEGVPVALHERNRYNGNQLFTNRYLKKVRYGNLVPFTIGSGNHYAPNLPGNDVFFLMEAVLDYGEHTGAGPVPFYAPQRDWQARTDPFSDHHAGFEVRTYRRCHRVLVFHRFRELYPEEVTVTGETAPVLVRSLDLTYRNGPYDANAPYTEADLIEAIAQTAYRQDGEDWLQDSLPAMTMTYQDLAWSDEWKTVTPADAIHAPQGLTGSYQWTDLWGEGLPGILTEQGQNWWYKSNLGNGHFSPARPVAAKPAAGGLNGGALQWQDLDADGRRQVVVHGQGIGGFFELSDRQEWSGYQPFRETVNVDWNSPYTKMLDLNGDGRPDLLLTNEQVWTWFENEGKTGFGPGGQVSTVFDEEKGPRLVLNDKVQSIYLADMNGDGMTDIVRIRNGEVCYWPNRGYGRFGAKVAMSQAPLFDHPELFNPLYLQLTDISGTGAADLVYLGHNSFRAWINLAGNAFSESVEIATLPGMDAFSKIALLDFMGNGTGCVVWSSPLPQHAGAPLRYIDLMGGKKPYLMNSYKNGMGKEVSVTYRSATHWYLQDKANGTPWATRLPFPVQCIDTISTSDTVSGATFTQSYSYHHGYYDHEEREFRGFGRVDVTDTDTAAPDGPGGLTVDQPPVLTRTWYHTGAWMQERTLLDAFKEEYFSFEGWSEPDTQAVFPHNLNPQEQREAYRALKGSALRQEVYALDGSAAADKPYTVTLSTYTLRLVQPKYHNRYAVFLNIPEQSLAYSCERNPADARLAHTLTLAVDAYGNVLESAQVAYPRIIDLDDTDLPEKVKQEQKKMHIVYSGNTYTGDISDELHYRLRVAWEAKSWEVTGLDAPTGLWTTDGLKTAIAAAAPIGYEETANGTDPQQRLLSHTVTRFAKDADPDTEEAAGTLTVLAIPYQQYALAFTGALLTHCYGEDITTLLPAGTGNEGGGYVLRDDAWWVPSGKAQYGAGAAARFYAPVSFTDPWDNATTVAYWSDYYLLPETVTDAKGNVSTVQSYDWRTLQPTAVKDLNDNISGICYDVLGMPVATAVMGKGTEADALETLAGGSLVPGIYEDASADSLAQLAFWDETSTIAEVTEAAKTLLGRATWRTIYDLRRQPTAVAMIGRERHYADDPDSPLVIRISYSDGFGRVAQHKAQCAPVTIALDSSHEFTANWICSGKTVYNNKGKAVLQYEPFFTHSHAFHEEDYQREVGVSPKLYYDPLGRAFRTDMPDGTYSFTTWDSWQQTVYDANDTTLVDGVYSPWYSAIQALAIPPGATDAVIADITARKAAADKALAHASTPTVMHLDSLARPFFTVQDDGINDPIHSYEVQDITGNRLGVVDGLRITADPEDDPLTLAYRYNLLNAPCRQLSIDGGEGRMLVDVAGQPLCHWDADDRVFATEYDALRRVTAQKVTEGMVTKVLERMIYGEGFGAAPGDDIAANMRGKVAQSYDGAGLISIDTYNFKGEPHTARRTYVTDATMQPDWTTVGSVTLETSYYDTTITTDALGRPVSSTTPDNGMTLLGYDRGGMLYSVSVDDVRSLDTGIINTILYNAKGQRIRVQYENGTTTAYTYDPLTFRVKRIKTTRSSDSKVLQDLLYWYDAVGNITLQRDDALQSVYYDGTVADPENDYTYDALYRLIACSGREHEGSNSPVTYNDSNRRGFTPAQVSSTDTAKMRRYTQYYEYDAVGNMGKMQHVSGAINRWTRNFTTDTASNRLAASSIGSNGLSSETYTYDTRGNMTGGMNHLNAGSSSMIYNSMNRLEKVIIDGNTTAYYQYDGNGQRVRKTLVNISAGITETRKYIGSWEVYSKKVSTTITLQRETLHVADDTGRMALIDTPTIDTTGTGEVQLLRYQYSNHLGTASLELDDNAAVISYEEYYPYGSTSFQSGRSAAEVSLKRYRYTGKERDEETGLNYHGARYYAPWLARWTAVDPINDEHYNLLKSHPNKNSQRDFKELVASSYEYCYDNPVIYSDPIGEQPPEAARNGWLLIPLPNNWFNNITEKIVKSPNYKQQKDNVLHAYDRLGFFMATWRPLSTFNMLRYLEGKGGFDVFSYSLLHQNSGMILLGGISIFDRSNDKIKNGIMNQVYEYAKNLQPGHYSFSSSKEIPHSQTAAPLSDFGTAYGSWTQLAKGVFNIDVSAKGEFTVEGTIYYTFADTYRWYSSGRGDKDAVDHNKMIALKEVGAKEFSTRAYYQQDITGDQKNWSSSQMIDTHEDGQNPEPEGHYKLPEGSSVKAVYDFREE